MRTLYFNKETGKEVHYGDTVTFNQKGSDEDCTWETHLTVVINNSTIPILISKNLLVQKGVEDNDTDQSSSLSTKSKSTKVIDEYSLEDKLDSLAQGMASIMTELARLKNLFTNNGRKQKG